MSTASPMKAGTIASQLVRYCLANRELSVLIRTVIGLGARAEQQRDEAQAEIRRLRHMIAAGVGPHSTVQAALALSHEAKAIRDHEA